MLAINGNIYRVENESEKSELAELAEGLMTIGKLKSLIAYLREGIKAKERLASDDAFDKHIESLISEGREDLKYPEGMILVKFEDEFEKLNAEQKARYYSLEAKCATIGAFIHPDGVFAKARKDFFDNKKNPTRICGKGQDAEISSFTSNFTDEEVDSAFFALQRDHRNIQAELNKIKSEVDSRVAVANNEITTNISSRRKIWHDMRRAERVKYDECVRTLKIVIPQNLKDIYNIVNSVANEK